MHEQYFNIFLNELNLMVQEYRQGLEGPLTKELYERLLDNIWVTIQYFLMVFPGSTHNEKLVNAQRYYREYASGIPTE